MTYIKRNRKKTLDDWPQVSNSDKNSPQNIAGNPKYDVVTKYMGEDWHIPTKAEWQELIDKCQWEDHDTYWLITGPSGRESYFHILA